MRMLTYADVCATCRCGRWGSSAVRELSRELSRATPGAPDSLRTDSSNRGNGLGAAGTQFTCFTGTKVCEKVQILTQLWAAAARLLPPSAAGRRALQGTQGGGFTGMFREDGGYEKEAIYSVQGVGWGGGGASMVRELPRRDAGRAGEFAPRFPGGGQGEDVFLRNKGPDQLRWTDEAEVRGIRYRIRCVPVCSDIASISSICSKLICALISLSAQR
jgi:hypothetical protein